ATTGQLVWDYSGKGYFTVNTPGTKAVVGFAGGKEFTLGGVKVEPACPFASLFLTALDRDATLADGKRALITAVARQGNTGFRYTQPAGSALRWSNSWSWSPSSRSSSDC